MCLAFSLFIPDAAYAQAWYTEVTNCYPDGTPVTGVDSNGNPFAGQMTTGLLTGSGTGTQTSDPVISSYYYNPSPNSWLQGSGTYNYLWTDEDPARVRAEAGCYLFNPDSDNPNRLTSNGNATVQFNLQQCFLWQAYWDDGDTGDPPNMATEPQPPASLSFLLTTRLYADAETGYGGNGYDSVSDSDYTGEAASCMLQDMFGEQVAAAAPAAPDPLSGGYNYQLAQQSGGGSHLLNVPMQMVNGQALYTVTLTGDGNAIASDSISDWGLNGDASATAVLDGTAQQDYRTVGLNPIFRTSSESRLLLAQVSSLSSWSSWPRTPWAANSRGWNAGA